MNEEQKVIEKEEPEAVSSSTSVRAFSRKNRVFVFREFLLSRYNNLNDGDVVLDVAGGKGDLSWLLSNVDDLRSVVLDPRKTNTHLVKSVHFLRDHPDELRLRSIKGQPTYQPLAALIPKLAEKSFSLKEHSHMRIFVDEDLVQAIRSYKSNGCRQAWIDYWEKAFRLGIGTPNLNPKNDDDDSDRLGNKQISDAFEALDVFLRARLVVGFHPDQATDYCIDLATELQIPFCIVPCCVFPSFFPHRALQDGTRVRNYDDLLSYLLNKVPDIQTAKLPFHETTTARNVALFTTSATLEVSKGL